jgi:hypothetical protein
MSRMPKPVQKAPKLVITSPTFCVSLKESILNEFEIRTDLCPFVNRVPCGWPRLCPPANDAWCPAGGAVALNYLIRFSSLFSEFLLPPLRYWMKRGLGLQMRTARSSPPLRHSQMWATREYGQLSASSALRGHSLTQTLQSTPGRGAPRTTSPVTKFLRAHTTQHLPLVVCADTRQRSTSMVLITISLIYLENKTTVLLTNKQTSGFWQGRRQKDKGGKEKQKDAPIGLMERITGTNDKTIATVYTAIFTNALVKPLCYGQLILFHQHHPLNNADCTTRACRSRL